MFHIMSLFFSQTVCHLSAPSFCALSFLVAISAKRFQLGLFVFTLPIILYFDDPLIKYFSQIAMLSLLHIQPTFVHLYPGLTGV